MDRSWTTFGVVACFDIYIRFWEDECREVEEDCLS